MPGIGIPVKNAQQLTIDKNGKNALIPTLIRKNIDVYGVNIQMVGRLYALPLQ